VPGSAWCFTGCRSTNSAHLLTPNPNPNPGTYAPAAAAAAAAADAKLARGLLRAVRDRLASLPSDVEEAEGSPQVGGDDEGEGEAAGDDAEGMRARTAAARRYRRARRTAWSAAEATLDDFRVAAKRAAAVQVRRPRRCHVDRLNRRKRRHVTYSNHLQIAEREPSPFIQHRGPQRGVMRLCM